MNLAVLPIMAQAAAPVAPVIMVHGDSLSAAYGIPREQGWVSLLQQRLQQQGLPYQVVNTSISGETTAGGLSRLQDALRIHQPSLVLIELGINDALRGLPLSEVQANLTRMITAAQQAKARVVLVGMMVPPNYGPRYAGEFKQLYPSLAQQYHLPLVPFLLANVAGVAELNQNDGIHPTAAAQPAVLDNVWKTLQPELAKGNAR